MKWKKYWSTVQVFIYSVQKLSYKILCSYFRSCSLVLYTMPSWVRSYNNNIAVMERQRPSAGRFPSVFVANSILRRNILHAKNETYAPTYRRQGNDPRLAIPGRSLASRPRESWAHRLHINQTDFLIRIFIRVNKQYSECTLLLVHSCDKFSNECDI